MSEENNQLAVYAPFLLVMLILSSIATVFISIIAVTTIVEIASTLSGSFSPDNTIAYMVTRISSVLIAIGSIASLALLWMRKKEGIILKFILLGLTILVTMGSAFFVNDLGRTIGNGFYSLGDTIKILIVLLSLIWNGGIATLWIFAWRAQEKHEGITKFLGSKKA